MADKISERHIRLEKIERLRVIVLNDIEDMLNSYKLELYNRDISKEQFEYITSECFALMHLKKYFNKKNLFMSAVFVDENEDSIIYQIKESDIDIWLDEDFNFVNTFLCRADREFYDVFEMLNEKYFAYNFTGIFDRIFYEKKMGIGS